MDKKRVFSGIQPTGNVHLGNYLGAIRRWAAEQGDKTNYFCVVDLHSLTVPQDPATLRFETRSLAALLLACGIDPHVSTVFIQSHVTAHAEGCWLLNCVTPLGWLQRMTQFKDKSTRQESVLTGLLDYPVLMAGDIILYDADEVPVGEDQKQHVELARDIAQRFNALYETEFFVVPQPKIATVAARVMGLDDPTVKMSKSLADKRGHAIRLLDEPDEILYAFKRAVTDSGREIRFSNDPEKAGVNNLLGIYQAVTGQDSAAVEADFAAARGYGDLKVRVAEVVIELLRPIQARHGELMDDTAELDRILAHGAEQARAVSQPKVDEMKRIMGLVLPG
ncbi:tryptophanyl-tRNA synthetase [Candidatus Promineifilum breve]|uniref:Tryptophan--tRNA ligase n=1 Tax=Candidatus Promineifilum breve TaxID=1806508 RepID=A0A160T1R7_9CHLR|nr:tryptophan--tRNA ligase [Candidatus Promineifilum breve]CUS03806.2 tryptophanyl-tRNA synthetase [Candidatus Promineifilum breve]